MFLFFSAQMMTDSGDGSGGKATFKGTPEGTGPVQ